MTWVAAFVAGLILVKWVAQVGLERLNRAQIRRHAPAVPEAYRGMIDAPTYARSVDYALARSRFHEMELACRVLLLLAVLFSGALPRGFDAFTGWLGHSAWAHAAFLFAVGLALSGVTLPLDWHEQFRLEQRFGFNTTTRRFWWTDRLKGLLLSLLLGYPLLALVLKLVDWAGDGWWLWA
jgi:STE24 endopeptidase